MVYVGTLAAFLALLSCFQAAQGQDNIKNTTKAVEHEVPQELVENLACTWSDHVGCFLDYLGLMPPSEIKNFYKLDEECSQIQGKTDCSKNEKCDRLGKTCAAKIYQSDLTACAAADSIEQGSLCGVFKLQNVCRLAKTKKKCKKAGCEWDKDGSYCVPSQIDVATMEFLGNPKSAKLVLDYQEECLGFSTRVSCEESKAKVKEESLSHTSN